MQADAATAHYSSLAKAFHWLTATLVITMICLGLYMTRANLDLGHKFQLYQLHKSLGITILLLTLIRIAVRFFRPPPPLPAAMPAWEKAAAHTTHVLLYTLLLAMTLSGWAVVSAASFAVPTKLYGVLPWPHIPFLEALTPQEKKTLEPILKGTHQLCAWSLTGLIALHIAAALRHGIVLKDGVMSRMLPSFSRHGLLAAFALGSSFLCTLTGPASAIEWDVRPEKSTLAFETNAGGQTVKGTFQRFKSEIRFDEDSLTDTEINITIDTASAVTGTAEIDNALPGAEFFNVAQFPNATFKARGAKEISDGKYEATGELTIRGVTKPVALPFSLDISQGEGLARGAITINRSDFGIGPKELAGGIPLDDEVTISFAIDAVKLDN